MRECEKGKDVERRERETDSQGGREEGRERENIGESERTKGP